MLVKQNLASKMITRIKWVLGIALILQSESGKTLFSTDIAVGTSLTIVAAQSFAPFARLASDLHFSRSLIHCQEGIIPSEGGCPCTVVELLGSHLFPKSIIYPRHSFDNLSTSIATTRWRCPVS